MVTSVSPSQQEHKVRHNKKTTKLPTMIYSGLFWIVFVGICLVYAKWASSSNDIDIFHSFMVMGIVILVVTFFAFLPAVMYFVFDQWGKERAEATTAAELKHHDVGLSDRISKDIEEANLKAYEPGSYQLPVLLTTFSMIVGWVLFFFSEGPKYLYALMRSGNISYIFSNMGNSHPVVFGFLGAFFWSLGTLFNRYVRGDLRATVFTHITIRIWSVIVLTLAIAAVWPGYSQFWIPDGEKSSAPQILLAFAFLVGMFPDAGVALLKKVVKGMPGFKEARAISLNEIDGLNLWDQGRLEEEGIQNVQNLATADVVELIVNTRLSVMSILNWVDQAILIYHAPKSYEFLRTADIPTATDFEAMYAGRLNDRQRAELAAEKPLRETYLGCAGITTIPEPDAGMLAALEKNLPDGKPPEFDVKERVHNVMTAICDDVSYQRLWKIRHGKAGVTPDGSTGSGTGAVPT